MKKQTIARWCEEASVKIIDNDGFKSEDFERELTEDEFIQGIGRCTVYLSAEFRDWLDERRGQTRLT